MAVYRGNYTDDLGRTHGGVSLVSRLYSTGEQPIELDREETELLPALFLEKLLTGRRTCSLPVTPRRIRAYLSSDLTILFEFPLPFMGGTDAYKTTLIQIESNPLILAYDILPERIPSGFLGWWLTHGN